MQHILSTEYNFSIFDLIEMTEMMDISKSAKSEIERFFILVLFLVQMAIPVLICLSKALLYYVMRLAFM